MRKLIAVVLYCLAVIACKTQEEPRKTSKEEYPYVIVDFLHWGDVDAEGDKKFFVYRCKYCSGVKDDLTKQQELLSRNRSDIILILRSSKISRKEKERKFEELTKNQTDTARIVGKMQEARRKFLEDEDSRLTK